MSAADKARAQFEALRELGVLVGARTAPDFGLEPAPARHVFSGHVPLWAYEDERFARPVPGAPPVFEVLDPASTLDAVLAKTRFVAVIGAAPTPELTRLLAEPGVFLLVFERDAGRLARFLAEVPPARLANKAFVFLGPPRELDPPLSALLTFESFRFGFPATFLPESVSEADRAYGLEVAQRLEILFYRHRVYPLSGQSFSRSIPLRNIVQDLFFDQLWHLYENLPAYALCPDIGALRGQFQGETAILAAAGAGLTEKLDYLRANQNRAVIIAVNSALKTLVEAGIRPHFCVVNDTSLQVAKTFEGLPRLRPVMLVGHALSCLGGEVFPQKFLFGAIRPDVFGPRPALRLHGSVLTTAFSLARHLGCGRAVLAGALLSSGSPWSLGYVPGKDGQEAAPEPRPLTRRFPQLCPVTNGAGLLRYTSLNFLDVKHWLDDEIRASGLEVLNTSRESILDTPPVTFDPAPDIAPTGRLEAALRRAHAARRRAPALAAALDYALAEAARHRACLGLLDSLEGLDEAAFLAQGRRALAVFDNNNVSYLVQRFEDFSQPWFHELVTSPKPAREARGLRYHFAAARRMLVSLLELLARQETLLRGQG